MVSLPTVGGDDNTWGAKLNEFLLVAHNADGTLKGNYKATTLAKSPIRYYRLDETSGTTAYDLGSGVQNGTLHGGITLAQPGLLFKDLNYSMLFNGSSGYISVPTTGMPTGAAAWSMECWVHMPLAITAAYGPIMEFGTFGGTANQGARLDYGGGFGNAFAIDNADWSASVQGTLAPLAGHTYHLIATYDGTTIRLYINGELAGSTAYTFNIVLASALIGTAESGGYWTGRIDEAAWYASALSQTQVTEQFLMGSQQLG
jgi:Concanavalin A-like lectin/glucanases superfamily